MLDQIDLDSVVEKERYKELVPELSLALLQLQLRARRQRRPVMLVFEGWDGSGIGDAIGHLGEIFDPRHLETHAVFDPTREESYWPFLWRFWIRTPAAGEMAIFDRSWNQMVVRGQIDGSLSTVEHRRLYRDIVEFERQLVQGGTLIVKLFLHVSKKEQKRRFKRYAGDPYERWRVTRESWKALKQYDRLHEMFDEMLENTSTAEAPWDLIPADHRFYRRLKVYQVLLRRLEEGLDRLDAEQQASGVTTPPPESSPHRALVAGVPSMLDRVDLSVRLEPKEYRKRLKSAQVRLRELLYACYERRVPVAVLFEGWDAAGKGGAIKRLVSLLDPRSYKVSAISAPTEDELRHHYLWRFWRAIPKAGHLQIFDRSWYGRVLVERVEGLTPPEEWKRAYREIREFERQLADYGTVVAKFWLHISEEEQLRRFREREANAFKSWKLTDEDWRNREKWNLYLEAVREMLERTSTTYAPWTVVENEDKKWGRVKVIETLNAAIEARLAESGEAGESAAETG